MSKRVFILFVILVIYTVFWATFFNKKEKKVFVKKSFVSQNKDTRDEEIDWPNIENTKVLSVSVSSNNEPTRINLPEKYLNKIIPRKQAFNLSCEFAAAASIIFHFTNNPDFSIKNEKDAEKALMAKVGVSQNPNVGIRMGKIVPENEEILYQNLNDRFGGTDYYGIHAPPFIDIFESFRLRAKPINKNDDLIYEIQKSIYLNRLVMAWMHVGYGQKIDVALSYGVSVPVIRGEHTVVVYGYDKQGLFVMDPGTAMLKKVAYKDFLHAIKLFPIPLLEIYPSLNSFTFDPTFPVDNPTGLNRSFLKVKVENAGNKIGAASEVAEILKDFGYRIISIDSSGCSECEGIRVNVKKEFSDYLKLLKRDFNLAFNENLNLSSDLSASDSADAVITVGE